MCNTSQLRFSMWPWEERGLLKADTFWGLNMFEFWIVFLYESDGNCFRLPLKGLKPYLDFHSLTLSWSLTSLSNATLGFHFAPSLQFWPASFFGQVNLVLNLFTYFCIKKNYVHACAQIWAVAQIIIFVHCVYTGVYCIPGCLCSCNAHLEFFDPLICLKASQIIETYRNISKLSKLSQRPLHRSSMVSMIFPSLRPFVPSSLRPRSHGTKAVLHDQSTCQVGAEDLQFWCGKRHHHWP